ncbi:hypothetical protein L198_05628 [Cryptococcus wingfieldii CBS 7118]|uniref:Uncharacterized protein n=1 Tax=Cryptococcus wingfieldii CBS 7118 TaxID=1295528 RepID=A0A1E3IW94_9TREE|nr:hypothetical protein L198_05628 [Cryptococcus wingfieldii CBS 7118]ODN92832.1 hypothetical protein L198_05628 [Cryptococcus wingfieldii CBS 7118]
MILALLSIIFSIIKYVHYPPFHWEGADTSRKTNLIPVAVLSAVNCAVLFAWLVVVVLLVQRAKRNGTWDWGKGITWMQQDEAERQKVGDAQRLRKVQSYDA